MRDPLLRADKIRARFETERRVFRPYHQVAAHATRQIENDAAVLLPDPIDDFAKQRGIPARRAGTWISDVKMDDGGAGRVSIERRGGDLMIGTEQAPLNFKAGTDFVGPHERIAHVIELLPEIGSLDCGSLNFDELLYGTTPGYLRSMARAYQQKNVRPELEVFELGHIEIARQLLAEGLINQPALFQLCLGIKYGAPATSEAMKAMRDALPPGSHWSAFGLGRMQMPMVAQSVLLGGNVRVGLEDNLYLDRGVPATNAQLVERARSIVELLGIRVLGAQQTRERLGLAV